MMEKYVPMVREALEEVTATLQRPKRIPSNFRKCRIVCSGCRKISKDGQDEVAILSIGYADG